MPLSPRIDISTGGGDDVIFPQAAERTPDTLWVDPPLRPRCGSALPAGGGTGQSSDGRWRGPWSPPPVPAPARNGSAVDAGRTARLSSRKAAVSTTRLPERRARLGPERTRADFLSAALLPLRKGWRAKELGVQARGGGNPAAGTTVCPRKTARAGSIKDQAMTEPMVLESKTNCCPYVMEGRRQSEHNGSLIKAKGKPSCRCP